MNAKELLAFTKRIRVLENTFTNIRGERKMHRLFTTTPRSERFPDERDQLSEDEILDFLESVKAVCEKAKRL